MSIQFPLRFRCCLSTHWGIETLTWMASGLVSFNTSPSVSLFKPSNGFRFHRNTLKKTVKIYSSKKWTILPPRLLEMLPSPNLLMVCSAESGSAWPRLSVFGVRLHLASLCFHLQWWGDGVTQVRLIYCTTEPYWNELFL